MPLSDESEEILILGGGPAGLATGWAFEQLGRAYRILEAAPVHGGNARTITFNEFRYDTGPHRFHDKDPLVTKRVIELLNGDIHEVNAPSRILWKGRFVDFPLKPLQALFSGGISHGIKAGWEFTRAGTAKNGAANDSLDFASWAYSQFGRTIADQFLIPYSEKLWGVSAENLSPDIAGRRLPGFTFRAILKELLSGKKKTDHLEGRFLYPRLGYGQIVDAIAQSLTPGRLQCGSRVTRLKTVGEGVFAVGFKKDGKDQTIFTSAVVNTLPITLVVRMMDPPAPERILEVTGKLLFRDVILVALFFDQESISEAASLYFPDPNLEFTRAHEPRNRSREMSPPGKTSLVVEFPCFEGDAIWTKDEKDLVRKLVAQLDDMGLVKASKMEAGTVTRLRKAYPVYVKDYKIRCQLILDYLGQFKNLVTLGRGGNFFYGHVHDLISQGFSIAEEVDKFLEASYERDAKLVSGIIS